MNDAKLIFQNLKRGAYDEAFSLAIPIRNADGLLIGKLVPVGSWILPLEELVLSIVSWRNAPSRGLSEYTQVTLPGTIDYLRDVWINNRDGLFFLIQDDNNINVGHVGIMIRGESRASLENIRRGTREFGASDLIYQSENSLVAWVFAHLNIESIVLETISYNTPLIVLHESVGFSITNILPLKCDEKKIFRNGIEVEKPYEKYKKVEMCLTKSHWVSKYPH